MRTKAKIRFIEFLRPDSFWPYPYTLEQAFHVFQWMVKTGTDETYRVDGQWGSSGPLELLSRKPTCVNHFAVDPITSIEDLRLRFHYALLSQYPNSGVLSWRKEEGIRIDSSRMIYFPHGDENDPCAYFGGSQAYSSGSQKETLKQLFSQGRTATLQQQLNSFHPGAVECHGVRVYVTPAIFRFELSYGYAGSSWQHDLAATQENEPFLRGLSRAVKEFNSLVEVPSCS